jgi:fatty acid desaturase
MTNEPERRSRPGDHRISQLRPLLEAAGAYERATLYYIAWFGLCLALYALCFTVLLDPPSVGVRFLALAGTAVAMIQLGLFAHDIGHGAVVRGPRARVGFEMLTNTLFIGYGYTYGQTTHSDHHNHPNTEDADPDIDSDLFALYDGAAHGGRGLLARCQPLSIFIALPFWGLAIRIFAVRYAIRNLSRLAILDLVLISIHLGVWFGFGSATVGWEATFINYCAITLLGGTYMGAILVLPHVGTGSWVRATELPHFERQLASSRNYSTSALGALICGGLNLQIEHHLLPGIPSVRLRRARRVIRKYCAEHGLPYRELGYLAAWREVIVHTREMSRRSRERRVELMNARTDG